MRTIRLQEAPKAVSTTTTRSRPGWHSIGVSTPSQRPARPRPRLSRFPLVHRMIHLHRPDHRVDAAPLECVHRRGLGPVDMTRLRVSLARSSMRPSLNRSCASRSSTSASRSSVSTNSVSENRMVGASRQATDVRDQADHLPARSLMSEPAPRPVRVDSWGVFPDEFFLGMNERTDVLVAGLRRAGTMFSCHPANIANAVSYSRAGTFGDVYGWRFAGSLI